MRITVPLIVHRTSDKSSARQHSVSVLFRPEHTVSHQSLSDATAKLARELRDALRQFAMDGEHEKIWPYTWDPNPSLQRLKMQLELKKQLLTVTVPIVTFRHAKRRIAFCPLVEGLWFDIERGENLTLRTVDVVTNHIRESSQENADVSWVEFFKVKRKYWLSSLDLDVSMSTPTKKPASSSDLMELFGIRQSVSGATELYRVGRCLEEMYPDGLDRAFRRQSCIEQLQRWSERGNRRPLLLTGEPLVGKTAVIHEWVRQRTDSRRASYGGKEKTYLISPPRLISGMSYVGQWEERWNEILKTCKKKKHVLYFDDLLGLFSAGKSASSNLSAANILKGYVERRDVFVLAEMTPAELRVFRERDQGFADMFEILRIDEPGVQESLRMLISLLGELEDKHDCRFEPEVLSTLLELARQFSVRGVLPGAAASVLRQLAAKMERQSVARQHLLEFYQTRTGLDEQFVDSRVTLKRDDLTEFFEKRLIGQPLAIEAMADVVSIAKAQLGDSKRPLGTLLFAGPTGVGKTEAAKTLAEYLFGNADRILRFDLNEFVMPGSAQRLIGTFDRPDGLLTNAVRQRPFNVLLLDEIEKAHPEVFDLLLQVLGEGRLTDARGRTVDFTKSIIIMTSNVGASQAASSVGFVDSDESTQQRFMSAVRKFWRPEFFNRIDRVIPFRRLSRDDLAQIADLLLTQLLAREGFHRRPCTVVGDQDVLDWVVERGFSQRLGARAMRRAVDRELVGPIAKKLAAMPNEDMAILRMYRRDDGLDAEVLNLSENVVAVAPRPALETVDVGFFDAIDDYIDSMLTRCDDLKGAAAFDYSHPLAFERIATVDYLRQLRAKSKAIASAGDSAISFHGGLTPGSRPVQRLSHRHTPPTKSLVRRYHREMHAFQDLDDYLHDDGQDMAQDFAIKDREKAFTSLLDDLSQLPLVVPDGQWEFQRVLVIVRAMNRTASFVQQPQARWLMDLGDSQLFRGVEVQPDVDGNMRGSLKATSITSEKEWKRQLRAESRPAKGSGPNEAILRRPDWVVPDDLLGDRFTATLFEGHNAIRWLEPMMGTYVWNVEGRSLLPVQMMATNLEDGQGITEAIHQIMDDHRRYANARMDHSGDPFRLRHAFPLQQASAGALELEQRPSAMLAKRMSLPAELTSHLKEKEKEEV